MRNSKIETRVYFIQMGDDGPIKIGVSRNSLRRLAELQTASPVRLKLLVQAWGDESLERALHNRLSDHRMCGEWFSPSADVLAVLSEYSTVPRCKHPEWNGYCGINCSGECEPEYYEEAPEWDLSEEQSLEAAKETEQMQLCWCMHQMSPEEEEPYYESRRYEDLLEYEGK